MIILIFISSLILMVDKSGNNKDVSVKRFTLVQYSDTPLSELATDGIVDGLAQNGLIRDRDYQLTISNAQGDIATMNMMIDAVITSRPDLVFITSTPTLQAAIKKIKDIPVVFTVVADPILAGAGTTFENHLPNITGISTLGDYKGMIGWVKRLVPSAKVIGTLYSPGELNSVRNVETLTTFAKEVGIKVITAPVNNSQDIIDAALSLTSRKPDIICQIVDNLTSVSAGSIIKVAREQKIPVFGFVSDQVKMGAVLVVSRDYHQAGVDAVNLAQKVLNGENPANIPFEYVSKTNVLISKEAAAYFNIQIPPDVLTLKDVLIVK